MKWKNICADMRRTNTASNYRMRVENARNKYWEINSIWFSKWVWTMHCKENDIYEGSRAFTFSLLETGENQFEMLNGRYKWKQFRMLIDSIGIEIYLTRSKRYSTGISVIYVFLNNIICFEFKFKKKQGIYTGNQVMHWHFHSPI